VIARIGAALLLFLCLSCAGKSSTLWVSYGQREVDLILVDHEPPPF
jgi:hypothetical protein